MFVSGDSGGWLASVSAWMVPQPLGSPLYVALGHLVNLFTDDLALGMTIWLSAAPAALTVALVYLVVMKQTGRNSIALISSGVLLACGVFLTQATVLEEYTLPAMFLLLGYWAYISGHRWWTVIALAAGGLVHSIVILLVILWLVILLRDDRKWLVPALAFIGIQFVGYSSILWLMTLDTPRFMSGYLSLPGVFGYATTNGGASMGAISLTDMPRRILSLGSIIILSYGLALVPLYAGIRNTINTTATQLLVVAISVTTWLSLTSTDPTTWTFLCFGAPMVALLVATGLTELSHRHTKAIVVSVLFLLVMNVFVLNANTLTRENPLATDFRDDLLELPYGAYVAVPMGGAHGMGVALVEATERPDLIPLYIGGYKSDGSISPRWAGYLDWLHDKKGVDVVASKTEEGLVRFEDITRWAVENGKEVFWGVVAETPVWADTWHDNEYFNESFERILVAP